MGAKQVAFHKFFVEIVLLLLGTSLVSCIDATPKGTPSAGNDSGTQTESPAEAAAVGTSENVPDTLVRRDEAGGFSAGIIQAVKFVGRLVGMADSAATATSAVNAKTAESADYAVASTTAVRAENASAAYSAVHSASADVADRAVNADSAKHAATADIASTVEAKNVTGIVDVEHGGTGQSTLSGLLDMIKVGLGLGPLATYPKGTGTGPGNVVALDESGKLPPIDGSRLTGLSASDLPSINDLRLTLGKMNNGSSPCTDPFLDPTPPQISNIVCLNFVRGDRIALFVGGASHVEWKVYRANQTPFITIQNPDTLYDLYAYVDTAGEIKLEAIAWSGGRKIWNRQGVLVKSDDYTHRYLGTVYSDAAGMVHNNEEKRNLWNYYNRKPANLRKQFSSTTISCKQQKQAGVWEVAVNADSINNYPIQVEIVIGVRHQSPISLHGAQRVHTDDGIEHFAHLGIKTKNQTRGDVSSAMLDLVIARPLDQMITTTYQDLIFEGHHSFELMQWTNTDKVSWCGSWYQGGLEGMFEN